MQNLSKSKWRGQNGKFTKCKNCGKGFTVIAYNKHRLNCGLNVTTSTESTSFALKIMKKDWTSIIAEQKAFTMLITFHFICQFFELFCR